MKVKEFFSSIESDWDKLAKLRSYQHVQRAAAAGHVTNRPLTELAAPTLNKMTKVANIVEKELVRRIAFRVALIAFAILTCTALILTPPLVVASAAGAATVLTFLAVVGSGFSALAATHNKVMYTAEQYDADRALEWMQQLTSAISLTFLSRAPSTLDAITRLSGRLFSKV